MGGATSNAIRRNSIYSNCQLGIDLAPAGTTLNDPLDADAGANTGQNFPVLTSTENQSGGTLVQGTLNSTPNTTFILEFFDNVIPDPSGYGEGETFIGDLTVTSDASARVVRSLGGIEQ